MESSSENLPEGTRQHQLSRYDNMETSYDIAMENEKTIEERVKYDPRWGYCHDGGKRLYWMALMRENIILV